MKPISSIVLLFLGTTLVPNGSTVYQLSAGVYSGSSKQHDANAGITTKIDSYEDEHLGDDEDDDDPSHNSPGTRLLHYVMRTYAKEAMANKFVNMKMDLLLMKVKNTIEQEGIFETVVALFMV